MRPLILLTNDDGIASPGLMAAIAAAEGLGDLLIVAPATQQTGMGRSTPIINGGMVTEQVLRLGRHEFPAYAVPGSPAQSVLYGALVLAPRMPDLVISGINYGENIGNPVTGSGTVGAALEAASAGIPALAMSLETVKAYHYEHGADVHWEAASYFTRYFAELMVGGPLPFDVDVLNVNVPSDATPDTPWRLTTQSRQAYYEVFRSENGAPGHLAHLDYEVVVHWDTLEPGSDIQAFAGDRVVSVTPLSINLTSRTSLAELEKRLRA